MSRNLSRIFTAAYICLAAPGVMIPGAVWAEVPTPATVKEYCDNGMPAKLEGLWEFPDDETSVFIRRSDTKGYKYDIIVVSTPDCRLHPGDLLGTAEASADASKFRISLFSNRSGNVLTDMRSCLGTFDDRKGTLTIEPRKYGLRLRAWILPRFWRSVSVTRRDPAEKLPYGLIRIYPTYDGNGSSLLTPRYL